MRWNEQVSQRNLDWSSRLYTKLLELVQLDAILDIGCGIGTWLYYASLQGARVVGFDTQCDLIEYGRQKYDINLSDTLFERNNPLVADFSANLVTAIMIFEHLSRPRALAEEIATYCLKTGSYAFISVPFFNVDKHHQLLADKAVLASTVFNDVGAHVTYYSDRGLIAMFAHFGLEVVKFISAGGWRGCVFKPRLG